MPSGFDLTRWLTNHTTLLNESKGTWERKGYSVLTEGQNHFNLKGNSAVLAGKPDLVASRGDEATVIDAKTGRPSPADAVQVMLYMYSLPRALEQYRGLRLTGQVAYSDHLVDIPAEAVDEAFIRNAGQLITRLASEMPARRVPSLGECRFCELTPSDCPERAEESPPEEGTTDDFWVTAGQEELRPMETLTLTLHKTKDTKNKVVYGTKDGSVIQSVYIDKDALPVRSMRAASSTLQANMPTATGNSCRLGPGDPLMTPAMRATRQLSSFEDSLLHSPQTPTVGS